MPLLIVLSPAYYWLSDWPGFTWLLIACLYGDYFAVRLLNIPKLFVERKYWLIGVILVVLCDRQLHTDVVQASGGDVQRRVTDGSLQSDTQLQQGNPECG